MKVIPVVYVDYRRPRSKEFREERDNNSFNGWNGRCPRALLQPPLQPETYLKSISRHFRLTSYLGEMNAFMNATEPTVLEQAREAGREELFLLPWTSVDAAIDKLWEFVLNSNPGEKSTKVSGKEFILSLEAIESIFRLCRSGEHIYTRISDADQNYESFDGTPNNNGFLRTDCKDNAIGLVIDLAQKESQRSSQEANRVIEERQRADIWRKQLTDMLYHLFRREEEIDALKEEAVHSSAQIDSLKQRIRDVSDTLIQDQTEQTAQLLALKSNYAQVTHLRAKLLEGKNREIAVLQGKLKAVIEDREDLGDEEYAVINVDHLKETCNRLTAVVTKLMALVTGLKYIANDVRFQPAEEYLQIAANETGENHPAIEPLDDQRANTQPDPVLSAPPSHPCPADSGQSRAGETPGNSRDAVRVTPGNSRFVGNALHTSVVPNDKTVPVSLTPGTP